MVPCSVTVPSSLLAAIIPRHASFSASPLLRRHRPPPPITSVSNGSGQFNQQVFRQTQQPQPQPRTLFPGGYKRPELKVPTLVLQLDPDDVLSGGDDALNLIDEAVSKWVGIVVLSGNDASGGKLYGAACLLRSLLQDRAYLLVAERVDIAAAAAASGVLLSDQGLPTVVARNTMLDSKSELVVLPLVARIVHTVDAAVNASKSEGADFLVYGGGDVKRVSQEVGSVYQSVKIPVFVSCGKNVSYAEVASLFAAGASGFVTSLASFSLFGDEFLHKLFDAGYTSDKRMVDGGVGNKLLDVDNGVRSETEVMAGFVKLEDREKLLIEMERTVLNEVIEVIKKAAPLMEEVSLLNDAISQIDEPFLLVIVVIER